MAREGIGKTLAERGKAAAVRFLEHRGYEVLEQDWRCEHGTADIVATQGDTYVFAKVSTCVVDNGMAAGGLTRAEYELYENVAKSYLEKIDAEDRSCARLDAIDILVVSADRALIRHCLNAAVHSEEGGVQGGTDGDEIVPETPEKGRLTELVGEFLAKEEYVLLDTDFYLEGQKTGFSHVALDTDGTLVFFVARPEEGLGDEFVDRAAAEALMCGWLVQHPETAEAKVRVDLVAISSDGARGTLRHVKNVLGCAA
jgi:putative endonuclease